MPSSHAQNTNVNTHHPFRPPLVYTTSSISSYGINAAITPPLLPSTACRSSPTSVTSINSVPVKMNVIVPSCELLLQPQRFLTLDPYFLFISVSFCCEFFGGIAIYHSATLWKGFTRRSPFQPTCRRKTTRTILPGPVVTLPI